MLDTYGRKYVQPVFDSLGKLFIRLGMTPVQLTFVGAAFGMAAVTTLYFEKPVLAVVLLWVSGLFDVLDGTVARLKDLKSDLGAFLDITLDRVVEVGIILALAVIDPQRAFMLVVLTVSIVLSMTIFLTVGNFARNSSKKSFYYQAGIAERTEGFILFSLMILFPGARSGIGYFFAILIFITALQRFIEGVRILSDRE